VTVKELKHMLENAEDNAIVVVRNNWAPAEFLNTSARKMVLVKANGNRVVTRGNSDATEQIRKTRMPPNTSHLFAQMLVKRLTLFICT